MKTLVDLKNDGKIADHLGEDDLFYLVQDDDDLVITTAMLRDKLRGYSVYSAQISQSGTSAPTVTILENTIGDIVWSRIDVGQYEGVLADMFADMTKVMVFVTPNMINISGPSVGKSDIVPQISDPNTIALYVIDTSIASGADNGLSSTTIEIRVYSTPTT